MWTSDVGTLTVLVTNFVYYSSSISYIYGMTDMVVTTL